MCDSCDDERDSKLTQQSAPYTYTMVTATDGQSHSHHLVFTPRALRF